jgi:hypothetical protein
MNTRTLLVALASLVSFSAFADTKITDYVPLVKLFRGSSAMKVDRGDMCTMDIIPAMGGDGHVARVDAGFQSAMSGVQREFHVEISGEDAKTLKISGKISYQYYQGQPEIRNLGESIDIFVDKATRTASYVVKDGKRTLQVCTGLSTAAY